jgi:hypothetical protein
MLRSLLSFAGINPNADYIFPTVDPNEDGPDCQKDCADCTVRFPANVKVETSRVLYGQTKEIGTHVLVATGKADWKEKVEHEPGSLMEAFHSNDMKSKYGVRMLLLQPLGKGQGGTHWGNIF